MRMKNFPNGPPAGMSGALGKAFAGMRDGAMPSEGRLQHMQQEASRKGRLQEEREEVEGNLRLIDGQLEAKRTGADVLKLKLDSLRSAQRELQELETRLPRMNQELRQLHQQGEGHRQRIEQYQDSMMMLGHSGYLQTCRRALVYCLRANDIEFSNRQVDTFMQVWQELRPYEDSVRGLERLKGLTDLQILELSDTGVACDVPHMGSKVGVFSYALTRGRKTRNLCLIGTILN